MVSKKEYWKNPEKYRAATRKYQIENPEWKKRANREWMAKKRAEDPEFVAKERLYTKNWKAANKETVQKFMRDWHGKHPNYHTFKNAQFRAKRDGVPFDIAIEDIVVPEVCPVLGIKLANYKGGGRMGFKDDAPSLDRVIPSKGYVRGNVRVISNRANMIKRDATAAELRAIADYIDRETGPTFDEIKDFINSEAVNTFVSSMDFLRPSNELPKGMKVVVRGGGGGV